ncbi:hypothetical protein EIN_052410 [Entamoeba invadens IP1]|uniref:hypothetical protein n=1 Tax=Entamoeba invadens IP1 TaxID=370355 RepID=UPI0002C3DB85|nr:hypothetical protein EIN_052410 [Entamoeba invadens IP1]ELP93036.1 hypothetical protein EIN_052410 [Entamoeba invadens IP1]|eukprot:XP_004259807.1 hypothetical protein EIN_052410 [Entamoeba invadens IP1]
MPKSKLTTDFVVKKNDDMKPKKMSKSWAEFNEEFKQLEKAKQAKLLKTKEDELTTLLDVSPSKQTKVLQLRPTIAKKNSLKKTVKKGEVDDIVCDEPTREKEESDEIESDPDDWSKKSLINTDKESSKGEKTKNVEILITPLDTQTDEVTNNIHTKTWVSSNILNALSQDLQTISPVVSLVERLDFDAKHENVINDKSQTLFTVSDEARPRSQSLMEVELPRKENKVKPVDIQTAEIELNEHQQTSYPDVQVPKMEDLLPQKCIEKIEKVEKVENNKNEKEVNKMDTMEIEEIVEVNGENIKTQMVLISPERNGVKEKTEQNLKKEDIPSDVKTQVIPCNKETQNDQSKTEDEAMEDTRTITQIPSFNVDNATLNADITTPPNQENSCKANEMEDVQANVITDEPTVYNDILGDVKSEESVEEKTDENKRYEFGIPDDLSSVDGIVLVKFLEKHFYCGQLLCLYGCYHKNRIFSLLKKGEVSKDKLPAVGKEKKLEQLDEEYPLLVSKSRAVYSAYTGTVPDVVFNELETRDREIKKKFKKAIKENNKVLL